MFKVRTLKFKVEIRCGYKEILIAEGPLTPALSPEGGEGEVEK